MKCTLKSIKSSTEKEKDLVSLLREQNKTIIFIPKSNVLTESIVFYLHWNKMKKGIKTNFAPKLENTFP